MVVISVLKEHAYVQQSFAVPDHVFDLGFFFLCSEVVSIVFFDAYYVLGKTADSVTND